MVNAKSFAVKLAVLAVTTLILLAALEITFRASWPQPTISKLIQGSPAIYEESDYLPWQLKASSEERHDGLFNEFDVMVKTNSLGLRNKEIKEKDAYRILMLGDSFTFGYGVENEESYPVQLQKILNERLDREVEIINAAYASGYAPDSYYAYLKKEGLALKPDMVLIGLMPANDFVDFSQEQWAEVDERNLPVKISQGDDVDDKGRRRQPDPGRGYISNPLVYKVHLFFNTHSHVYAFAKHRLKNFVIKQNPPALFFSRKEYTGQEQMLFNKTADVLKGIADVAKENNVSLGIIVIPSVDKLNQEEFDNAIRFYGFNPNNFDRYKVPELMAEFGKENNVQIMDLQTPFEAYVKENKEKLYFDIDKHWTPRGHVVAAEFLADYLVEVLD